MQIAVQEQLLTGKTILQKFKQAQALGISGIEVRADDLTARVPALAEAMMTTGMAVAAVNMGQRDGTISPRLDEREAAINALRQAMANAVDLDAAHVVFVPRFGRSPMPDLTPWRAPVELDGEMTVWLLRGVSDLAYAIGVELDILPLSTDETDFINRIEQAVMLRRKIREHKHVKIAASLSHMRQTETDWPQTLRDHLAHIGYIQIPVPSGSDSELRDCSTLATILRDYTGWVTLTGDASEGINLEASLSLLRQVGIADG
jgi:sugar phosphate isomerase/epimerase